MPEERRSDESRHLIGAYQRHVAQALLDYMAGEHGRWLRGDRDGDRLVLTFVLEDADEFHEHLNRLNRDHPDSGRIDPPDTTP